MNNIKKTLVLALALFSLFFGAGNLVLPPQLGFNFGYIIAVAIPALMFIYPLTIVLIFLNIISDKYASPTVFKAVVISCIVFSVPDFVGSIDALTLKIGVFNWIPLNEYGMGWVLPCIDAFVTTNLAIKLK